MKLKVIITGSTGMVGEGILQECLLHQDIEKILVINRRPCNVSNSKLTEIIHDNFFDLSPFENQLTGYDACFYALGITSLKIRETAYYNITFTLTLDIAGRLLRLNPKMTFCYVSGFGANSSDKSIFMQTRVKGLIEDELFKLPYKNVYSFRPGLLKPGKGLRHTHKIYLLFTPFYPVFRLLFPGFVSELKELGLAMIQTAKKGYEKKILEAKDIVTISKK